MDITITNIDLMVASPFYALAAFIGWRLWRGFESQGVRIALVLFVPVVLALPFADEMWITWQFDHACSDAGVKVYRRVDADGFANATNTAVASLDNMSKPSLIYNDPKKLAQWDAEGFRFKEQMRDDGKAWHVERRADGVYGWVVDKPIARYQYRYANSGQWVTVARRISKNEVQVVDLETGEILGREVSYERYPGFVRQLWIQFVGAGQRICNRPLDDIQNKVLTGAVYSYVLIPKKTN